MYILDRTNSYSAGCKLDGRSSSILAKVQSRKKHRCRKAKSSFSCSRRTLLLSALCCCSFSLCDTVKGHRLASLRRSSHLISRIASRCTPLTAPIKPREHAAVGLPWARAAGRNSVQLERLAVLQDRLHPHRRSTGMPVRTSSHTRHLTNAVRRYTPLRRIDHMPAPLPYDPIRCNGCSAVLNPYA